MPFEKGKSGNPGGKPKQKPITDMYRYILHDEKRLKRFCMAQFRAACKGDVAAARDITDRIEGKPNQTLDLNDNRTNNTGERLAELFSEAIARNRTESNAGRTQ